MLWVQSATDGDLPSAAAIRAFCSAISFAEGSLTALVGIYTKRPECLQCAITGILLHRHTTASGIADLPKAVQELQSHSPFTLTTVRNSTAFIDSSMQ